jgi:hypothetical protein
MKQAFVTLAAIGAVCWSAAALAQSNSTPGIDRYLDNPGRQQATAVGAQCGSGAGSGAFGFFGKDNNLGQSNPNGPGANGTQTGLNNSAVCGNRQGNLP